MKTKKESTPTIDIQIMYDLQQKFLHKRLKIDKLNDDELSKLALICSQINKIYNRLLIVPARLIEVINGANGDACYIQQSLDNKITSLRDYGLNGEIDLPKQERKRNYIDNYYELTEQERQILITTMGMEETKIEEILIMAKQYPQTTKRNKIKYTQTVVVAKDIPTLLIDLVMKYYYGRLNIYFLDEIETQDIIEACEILNAKYNCEFSPIDIQKTLNHCRGKIELLPEVITRKVNYLNKYGPEKFTGGNGKRVLKASESQLLKITNKMDSYSQSEILGYTRSLSNSIL